MIDNLEPWIATPLALIAWIVLAIIIRMEVRRERASSTTALDHTRTQAQGHHHSTAAPAVRGVRPSGDSGSAVAGGAPRTGVDGWPADSREHGSSAHLVQSEGGRQARRAGDELATTASAGHPRLVTR